MKTYFKYFLDFLKLFASTFLAKDIFGKSAQTAYYFVFSIFPIALLTVAILPLLNVDITELQDLLYSQLPVQLADVLYQIFYAAFNTYSSGVVVIGAVILMFWSASAATNSIVKGINMIYDGMITRNYLIGRLISFILTISFFLYIFMTLFSASLNLSVLDFGVFDVHIMQSILNLISVFLLPIFISVILLIIYYVAPAKKMTIKQTLPGVMFWILAFNIFSFGFDTYVTYANNMSATYGSFTGFIIFMLWCYALSMIILTGAVINVTLHKVVVKYRMDQEVLNNMDESTIIISKMR